MRLALVGTLLAGCGEYSLDFSNKGVPARGRGSKPELWTMFEIQRAFKDGRPIAPTKSFPDGLPSWFLVANPDGSDQQFLQVNAAFSEGDAAAFVVPEVWLNMPEVWLQPWYFLITEYNEAAPLQNRLRADPEPGMAAGVQPTASPAVWDVGPRSLFYSPFWAVFYALAPKGTHYLRYKSAEQIFNDKLPLFPGQAIIYSVRPREVTLGDPMTRFGQHPHTGLPIGGISASANPGYVDGEEMYYFNEGSTGFRYSKTLVIEEVPLFILAKRNMEGQVVSMGVPPVMGSGPLGERRAVDLAAGRPRFGAFSRVHLAIITNPTAEAFDPAVHTAAVAVLAAKPDPKPDANAYKGRVALNGKYVSEMNKGCFQLPTFPTACTWLDSQTKIEDNLRLDNLIPTEVTMCSPLVYYGGKGIGR